MCYGFCFIGNEIFPTFKSVYSIYYEFDMGGIISAFNRKQKFKQTNFYFHWNISFLYYVHLRKKRSLVRNATNGT